jgi:cyclophilin family peptidyl-prolyl cis-trans isomerase
VPTPWLDDAHTIFGEVTSGQDIVDNMQTRDPSVATAPGVEILGIDIIPSLRIP